MTDKIIDSRYLFRKVQFLRTLKRLLNLNEEFKAQVWDDPVPYLQKAREDIIRHRKVIEDIKDALRIDIAFWNVDPSEPIKYFSIEDDLMRRLNKIEQILQQFDKRLEKKGP